MASLLKKANEYGNLNSGMMACTLPKPDADVGCEATILRGRDRDPAKVVDIERTKAGKVKAYVLQAYRFDIDYETEGYAKVIHWDQPRGEPERFPVVMSGRMAGTVKDALIGEANAFYDRSF